MCPAVFRNYQMIIQKSFVNQGSSPLLISEEVFTFKDPENAPVASSVKDAIKANHRRHIAEFKHFAEDRWLTF